jgi:hypothetical protein
MFSAIRSSHRPTTLITRVTAALPDLPHRSSRRPTMLITRVTAAVPDLRHPRGKRHRRVGAVAIVSAVAGLVAVLIGTAAVIFRKKPTSSMSRGDEGEEQTPAGSERTLASVVRAAEHKLASIVSHDGGEEKTPAAAGK